MKISHVEKFKVVVPMKPDTVNSPEFEFDAGLSRFDEIPKFVIRVHTNEGVAGIGETKRAVPEDAVDRGIAAIVGRDPTKMPLHNLPIPRNGAYGAFEIALFDIVGKVQGVPAHVLLGGAVRDRVLLDYWTGRRTPEDLARIAREGQKKGFTGIKIKCALEDPNVARIQAVAEACGPSFAITVDPNTRFYQPIHAIRLAKQLEGYNIQVFEDPVPKDRLDWYVYLRSRINIPLGLHLGTIGQVWEALHRDAVDCLNISTASMVAFVRLAYLAEAAGVPVWHGGGMELGILDAAVVHACAVAPACTLPSDIHGNFLREDDLLVEPLVVRDSHVLVPDKPGLGVELDEEGARRYAWKN